jgi:predicted ATP-grasp superfamily ATP-dependent carboligase
VKILAYDHRTVRYGDAYDRQAAIGFSADRALQSLLADLCRLQRTEVSLLRDPAQPPLPLPASVRLVACPPPHATQILAQSLAQADAVWPVAPESAGMLEMASLDILRHGRTLIGSHPDAVRIFGSKHETSRVLRAAGIPVVETWRLHERMPARSGADERGWVVKPDDGAGCSDTRIFPDRDAAGEWIAERDPARYVLQPYIHGRPCSISMVCAAGKVLLMSVDETRMAVFDNQLHCLGSTVSGADNLGREALALAERVMAAVPGLWGYAGIDFLIGEYGPVVLEVNPRVTLSHAGMRQSLGHNPARLVVELLRDGRCAALEKKRNRPVSIVVDAFAEHLTAGH